MIDNERFYSSIVQIKVGEQTQEAIMKDVQMHPAKNLVVHVDLVRVVPNEKIRIHLPIHFKNESVSPGVKVQGGVVSHRISDVEITCLPQDLPEFIELDLSQMNINETKFLSDLPLPNGVSIVGLAGGENPPVVSIHAPRAEEPEPTAEAAAGAAAEGAAAAAPAAGAAPCCWMLPRRTTRLLLLLPRRMPGRSKTSSWCRHPGRPLARESHPPGTGRKTGPSGPRPNVSLHLDVPVGRLSRTNVRQHSVARLQSHSLWREIL